MTDTETTAAHAALHAACAAGNWQTLGEVYAYLAEHDYELWRECCRLMEVGCAFGLTEDTYYTVFGRH